MGVAVGKFLPGPAYDTLKQEVVASTYSSQDHLDLAICAQDGERIPSVGVHIYDASLVLTADDIQVEILGIPWPLYGELFPDT
jgi:hypothetical protein